MATRRDARAATLATWIARFLRAVAVFCVVTVLFPVLREPLEPVRDAVEWTTIGAAPSLAYAAFLGILAAAVRRRKRIAWWFLVLLLIIPNMAYDVGEMILRGHGYLSFGLLTMVLAILLLARPAFNAEVAPRAGWRALATVVGATAVAWGIGAAVLMAFPGVVGSLVQRAETALVALAGGTDLYSRRFDLLGELGAPPAPHVASVLLGLLGAAIQVAGAWVLFRPRRASLYQTPADDHQIRMLLTAHSGDSLGYFATRQDKSAIFAPIGTAAVVYRVVAGVSLASGDPVGDPRRWPAAIEAWLAEARRFAWSPAVMGTTEQGALAYDRAGLRVLELGEEAVVRTDDFSLQGRRLRGVRQAVQRLERQGYHCRVRHHAELTAPDLARVTADADRWRGTQSERGFSMALGRLGDPRDGDCVLVECLDGHGALQAFLSFVPWGHRGLSLDLMRRSPSAPNGVVELMVTQLVEVGRTFGIERVSLNFAVFRSGLVEGAEIGAGPVARLWRRTLLLASRWWQIEALYRANAKFDPDWVPRYLCYPKSRDLPRIALASGMAEGLIPAWRGRRLRAPEPRPGLPSYVWEPRRAPLDAEDTNEVTSEVGTAHETRGTDGRTEPERVRQGKLLRLRSAGVDPYPAGYPRTASTADVTARFAGLPPDTWTGERVGVAGRVVHLRRIGPLCFSTLRDAAGDLQVMLDLDRGIDRSAFEHWKRCVDVGDQVGVTGQVGTSRTGELTVHAESWALIAKCLRPLPARSHTHGDVRARADVPGVDLAIHPAARMAVTSRSAVISAVRDTLRASRFVEVESPATTVGAGALPSGPSSATQAPLYRQVAPHPSLAGMLVGGLERVFTLERGPCPDNVDPTNRPTSTVLVAYQAYGDDDSLRSLARELVLAACRAVHGGKSRRRATPDVDLASSWAVVGLHEAVGAAVDAKITPDTDRTTLLKYAADAGVLLDPSASPGAAVATLYDSLVVPATRGPRYFRGPPLDVSPLSRADPADPRLARAWDLVAFGVEVCAARSELVDPAEWRRRLTEHASLAASDPGVGPPPAEDRLATLMEYGMPPAGELSLDLEQLVTVLTDDAPG